MKSFTVVHRLAAALAAGLALAAACATAQPDASQPTGTTEARPDLDPTTASIEPLRQAAAVGDVDAALAVASRLVDRFEHGGATDDLFEAAIWIDRYHHNEAFTGAGLIARMQLNDCDQNVLRLHWICEIGE